jgi:hypothetical protein
MKYWRLFWCGHFIATNITFKEGNESQEPDVSVDQVCLFISVLILMGHNVQDTKKIAGQPTNSAILHFTEESWSMTGLYM